ncbi:putative lysine-specific demethylase JMJ14-like [Capsicum annuum]|nr:putative lysine-specific demethylase JMJ14-like [Capsicum annuum]
MENEGQREKGEAKNFMVSFSALRKDVVNVLDFMERLKNEEDHNAVDMADQIEELKVVLAFICTYVQLSHCDLEEFEDEMSDSRQQVENLLRPILDDVDNNVGCKHNMDHVLPRLMDNIDDCISSCHHSTSSATMTDEQLDFLLLDLHYLSMYLAEQIYPLETQYDILQTVSGNMKYFHGLIVSGCIEREIVEYVLAQFQLMAERVAIFLWHDRLGDSRLFKLAHLLMKIIPVELEVMQICYTNLKASPSVEVRRFIKKLLEFSLEVLREYLIHLQEHMVTVITPSTSGARNIHVMIEFLLVIVTDMPKDFIHHSKLFDLLARVGALIRKVSTLVHDLKEQSRNKESTNGTNCAALDLLKNIELLKEDLKYVYLKAPDSYQCCFPMNDGPLFMHLLLIHLNGLLESRVLDVAYEAKDVIDSIIVRDNGLLHLIFSLRITIKKIKHIKEEVSNISVKIPKNSSLTVVNSTKKPVERKSLTTGKIIVGFKEETNWLISKLTSGPKNVDVISIIVCSHFDVRAWCTVDQEYDEKKLLVELFNQVTGADLKSSEDIDVADKRRKQLYGKRYLIVLDDVWDTTTWDDLTRPFPEAEKGSRIILTTRQKEVTFHGKGNTDPLNLRLLRPEESWELLKKRAFGDQSCPDELLDVGK